MASSNPVGITERQHRTGEPVRGEVSWRAGWVRRIIRQAAALYLLLAVALLASLVIDAQQTTVPTPPFTVSCSGHSGSQDLIFLPAVATCQWEPVLGQAPRARRQITVQLAEKSHLLTATTTLYTSASDPVVRDVRRGDARQNPGDFESALIGFIEVGSQPFAWQAPVIQAGPGTKTQIVQQGTGNAGASMGPLTVTVYLSGPGVLRVTSTSMAVAGVQGQASVSSQTGHSLVIQASGGDPVSVDLAPLVAVSPPGPPALAVPAPVAHAASASWQVLRSFTQDLVLAIAWLALFLAGRAGALGGIARRPAWRRMDRALGMVLLAHLVISGAAEISGRETAIGRLSLWPGSGFAPVSGATVLFLAILVYGAAWWGSPARRDGLSLRSRRALATLCVSALIAVASFVSLIWAWGQQADPGQPFPPAWPALAAMVPVVASGVLAAITLAAAPLIISLGRSVAPGRRRRRLRLARIMPAVPAAAALAIIAALTADGGIIPLLIRWVVLIASGTIMGLAVVRLTVTSTSRRRSYYCQRQARVLLPYLIPFAAAAAVPWGLLGSHDQPIGWWDVMSYAVRVDDLLPLILITAGIVALRRLGAAPVTREHALRGHRMLGIAAWFIALSGSYTLAGSFSLPFAASLAVAAAAAWLLMPPGQVTRASRVLGQRHETQADAVSQALTAGAARRIIPAYSKAMRDKVTTGETPFRDAREKIAELEREAAISREQATGWPGVPFLASDERGFGSLTSRRPWRRAVWGARAGALTGAPWVLLGLAGAPHTTGPGEGYPELAIMASLTPLVIRWAAYGFLFGYFYPLIRGSTGMGKAVWFTLAAATPALLSTATMHPTSGRWNSVALLTVQLIAFAGTLGLLADQAVLRKFQIPASRVVDLHNLWTVSAWASSIGVAVATGVATVIIAGLQPFVIGTVTPSSRDTAKSHS